MGRRYKSLFVLICFLTILLVYLNAQFDITVKHSEKGQERQERTIKFETKDKQTTERPVNHTAKSGVYRIIKNHKGRLHAFGRFKSTLTHSSFENAFDHMTEYDISDEALPFPVNFNSAPESFPFDFHQTVSNNQTSADYIAMEKEHRRRIEILKSTCLEHKRARLNEKQKGNLTSFFYSNQYKFAYCKVPKSGSTFWMNVFMVLKRGDQYSKIMANWTRTEVHDKTKKLGSRPVNLLKSNTRTVIVSRNPYSRLYSAYIDKVYMPLLWYELDGMEGVKELKPFYVNSTQEVLKNTKRELPPRLEKYKNNLRDRGLLVKENISVKISPKCFNAATFEHFLKFIISEIKAGRTLEPHWAPITHLCRPCRFNTFRVIKQESFNTDVKHVLSAIGIDLSKYPYTFKTLTEDRAKTSIPSVVGVVEKKFSLKQISSCISLEDITKRLWKSFQIQGFISDDVSGPDKLYSDSLMFNKWKTIAAALAAISQKPMTSSDSKKQRHDHLVKAYAGISNQTLNDIQTVYYLDFVLFDYSFTRPS